MSNRLSYQREAYEIAKLLRDRHGNDVVEVKRALETFYRMGFRDAKRGLRARVMKYAKVSTKLMATAMRETKP